MRNSIFEDVIFQLKPMIKVNTTVQDEGSFSSTYSSALIYLWEDILNEFSKNIATLPKDINLFFIRHGKTQYNLENKISGTHNTQLIESGRQQAFMLSRYLSQQNFEVIFSSDLDRAFNTAEIFRDAIGINKPITKDYRLREINLGVIEGTRKKFLFPYAEGNIDYKPNGGESYREAARRIASFFVDLLKYCNTHRESKSIAIFTHGGVMRILESLFGNINTSKKLFNQNFSNGQILEGKLSEISVPKFWIDNAKGVKRSAFYK